VTPAPLVMKFGGTSVADAERIRNVAGRLATAAKQGQPVVGVVSAMGETTDELLALARSVSATPLPRELDLLLSVGEQISCALVAMAIAELGGQAVSLTGPQADIRTTNEHGRAKIVDIGARRIRAALAQGQIPLVTGFQGWSGASEITTLGRGGSDATAVALAAALDARRCEIYTDVDGVFTADPDRARRAEPRIDRIRRDARARRRGRARVAAASGGARARPSRRRARSLELHRRAGDTCRPTRGAGA
jgi:aspartate kinase